MVHIYSCGPDVFFLIKHAEILPGSAYVSDAWGNIASSIKPGTKCGETFGVVKKLNLVFISA